MARVSGENVRAAWSVLALVLGGCFSSAHQGNRTIESYSTAKKHVYALAGESARTFYCSCGFTGKSIVPQRCGYASERESSRSRRVEVEHIVPASHIGLRMSAWTRGHAHCVDSKGQRFKGRNCARKTSTDFRYMESDLYNLVPVVGQLNAMRKNAMMGEVHGEVRRFGSCDVEIADGVFEPPPERQGDIARIWLYMAATYPRYVQLSAAERRTFEKWSQADPVDGPERQRAKAIEKLQGNGNPFVK